MEETQQNRRWAVSNRLNENDRPAEDCSTLLYYKALLEAELEEVRRRLAALGVTSEFAATGA